MLHRNHHRIAYYQHLLIWLLALGLLSAVCTVQRPVSAQTVAPAGADSPTIVGGKEAAPGAWPWQAALVRADIAKAQASQFCGGSLVAAEWVLTAAHCVDDRNAAQIEVVLGRHELSSADGERIPVAEIILHPTYVSWQFGADLALLHLVQASTQRTVMIDTDQGLLAEERASRATVTGWGATEDLWSGSDVLREVSIPLISRTICNAPAAHAGLVVPDMLCAGYPKGGKGTCYGDSGGPLLIPDGEPSDWTQVGIVSWGPAGCNREEGYSVFTRVASFAPWIQACLSNVDAPACSGSDEYEPDNQPDLATIITTDGVGQTHSFHRTDDVDWIKFVATAGSTYSIKTLELGAKSDTILWLYEPDGVTAITYNDDDGDEFRASHIVWTATRTDTFLIQVENYRQTTGAGANYIVQVVELNQHAYLPIVSR